MVENILAMSMERRKTMKLRTEKIPLRPYVEEIASAQRMRKEKEMAIIVNLSDNASAEADKTHLLQTR